ncbi:MAG: hypothetical protein M1825_000102 [Sarcosagium campestre]|nr:MAG: hypothetical protein M1825_000102 [Sarcosagium campestre]
MVPNGNLPRAFPRRRQRTGATPRYSSAAAAAAAAVQGEGYKPREERGWEEFHPHLDIERALPSFSAKEIDGALDSTSSPAVSAAGPSTPIDRDLSKATNGIDATPTPTSDQRRASQIPAVKGESTPKPPDKAEGQEWGPNGTVEDNEIIYIQPKKRRVGRPPRRPVLNLDNTTSLATPKAIPPPGTNPRERLTLPKPSFRPTDSFSVYEQKAAGQQRYVDRPMANAGYQESDVFIRPPSRLIRVAEGTIQEDVDLGPGFRGGAEGSNAISAGGAGRVEYDMDEQDDKWLAVHNAHRRSLEAEPITREIFEITMTKIEKEWHALEKRIPKPNPKPPQTHRPRSSSAAAVNGEAAGAAGEEQDSKCAICDDGDCENTNAIVFCDGCDLAVHQECYGVPFIPEGQWLCRKCQLLGRSTTTCIFCPNTDGAFKQTNASRWSHLLCAMWIPEVSLGNAIFMEPVLDVEKVPRQRWKLVCYICRQKMGACIQCGNKNCFIAFHVTCARRARLFLKMKSPSEGPGNMDSNLLKAYCDRHVPLDWRRENDVDAAFADAQDFYRYSMRGTVWADNKPFSLAVTNPAPESHRDSVVPRINLTLGGNKRRRSQPVKSLWKLPSGAPVIPQVVFSSVETSLQKFTIRKRKDFAAEACKYWTMKREARRGAALLKRLQLQMETFSSMEITRRNFAGMGVAGRLRLQRRIEFADKLLHDVEKLRLLCDEVKKREREKLKDAEMQKDFVDTVYFPIAPLLWPIFEKAVKLDGKSVFSKGFDKLRSKLEERAYTSIASFSLDLGTVFTSVAGLNVENGTDGVDGAAGITSTGLTAEQKDHRRLAKRIIKAMQAPLEEAARMEAELGGKPFEKELKELELLLNSTFMSRRNSAITSAADDSSDGEGTDVEMTQARSPESHSTTLVNGDGHSVGLGSSGLATDIDGQASSHADLKVENRGSSRGGTSADGQKSEAAPQSDDGMAKAIDAQIKADCRSPGSTDLQMNGFASYNGAKAQSPYVKSIQPPTDNEKDLSAPLAHGGIPWYFEPFDPEGTTIYDERWTGREVVREMSEELSEIDDEELQGLVDVEMADEDGRHGSNGVATSPHTAAAARKRRGKRGRNGRKSRVSRR